MRLVSLAPVLTSVV